MIAPLARDLRPLTDRTVVAAAEAEFHAVRILESSPRLAVTEAAAGYPSIRRLIQPLTAAVRTSGMLGTDRGGA